MLPLITRVMYTHQIKWAHHGVPPTRHQTTQLPQRTHFTSSTARASYWDQNPAISATTTNLGLPRLPPLQLNHCLTASAPPPQSAKKETPQSGINQILPSPIPVPRCCEPANTCPNQLRAGSNILPPLGQTLAACTAKKPVFHDDHEHFY